jgi:hypothetical protein
VVPKFEPHSAGDRHIKRLLSDPCNLDKKAYDIGIIIATNYAPNPSLANEIPYRNTENSQSLANKRKSLTKANQILSPK